MLRHRPTPPLLLLASLALALGACSSPPGTPHASTSGSSTVPPTAVPPPRNAPDNSLATLNVTLSGLPRGAGPSVTVVGPADYSTTLKDSAALPVQPGSYQVKANDFTLNGQTYRASVTPAQLTLGPGQKVNVQVTYAPLAPGMVSLQLSPTQVTLAPGASQTFSASVKGAEGAGVTWTSTGGTLATNGNSATLTAPAEPGSYTVTAKGPGGQSASATVTVALPAPQSGTRVWVRQPALVDSLLAVGADADGNALVAGSVIEGDGSCNIDGRAGPPFCSYDAYVAKVDPGGKLLWSKRFGVPNPDATTVQTEAATDLAVDAGGNTLVVSSAQALPVGTAGTEGALVKFGPSGNAVWSAPLNDPLFAAPSVAVDASGNAYLLGGQPGDDGQTPRSVLARFDAASGQETGRQDVALRGAFFVRGPAHSVTLAGKSPDSNDAVLLSFGVDGAPSASRTLAAPDADSSLRSAALDAAGNAVATWTRGSGEAMTLSLVRYDPQGHVTGTSPIDWQQALDDPLAPNDPFESELQGGSVLAGPGGSVYVSYNVFTQGPGHADRFRRQYLAKLDAGGAQVWLNKIEANGGNTSGTLPVLAAGGALYQAGWAQGSLSGATLDGRPIAYQGWLIRWAP